MTQTKTMPQNQKPSELNTKTKNLLIEKLTSIEQDARFLLETIHKNKHSINAISGGTYNIQITAERILEII